MNHEAIEELQRQADSSREKETTPWHCSIQMHEPVLIVGNRALLTIEPHARIDSFVKLEVGLGMHVGRHVHIASFCHIGIGGGEVVLGDHSAFASGAKVISGSNRLDGVSCSAASPSSLQRVRRSRTVVEELAFVCAGAVVMPGVTVARGAVLAAGAVATSNIPPWQVWAGVPARFRGMRQVVCDLQAAAEECLVNNVYWRPEF